MAKNRMILNVILICMFILLLSSAAWAGPPPAVGSTLPDFSVTTPKDGDERRYLGLSFFSDSFKIQGLRTQVAIVQVFSMYCPYCQAEAPNVNRLYDKIEGDPSLKEKIKLIGIGAGNSPFEVGVFKKKYNVRFPLIPDKDFKIYNLIGEVRTPYFIAIRINPDGSHRVIYSRLGALGDVDKFLEELSKLAESN